MGHWSHTNMRACRELECDRMCCFSLETTRPHVGHCWRWSRAWYCLWRSRSCGDEKRAGHWPHRRMSRAWATRKWQVRLVLLGNTWPQRLHLNWWLSWCLASSARDGNLSLHCMQRNLSTVTWVSMWCCRLDSEENLSPQTQQRYGLSPVCSIVWIFRLSTDDTTKPQILHFIFSFLPLFGVSSPSIPDASPCALLSFPSTFTFSWRCM
ncbi:hypothetical protein EGW08_010495 [Elysia chlorotica]|uniref:Uncharacterized protein n=1 Tax=Elysia chlorotica TaxID=188477 RepID=A0A433TJN6_ELYCH|nr:hypothetical protein EGW08_010495 [Elysia chlorotica]